MRALILISLAAALAVGAASARAQTSAPIESVTSTIDAYTAKKLCRKTSSKTQDEEFGEQWRCPGVAGVDVFLHHEDARDYLAYGRRGKQETSVFGVDVIGGIRETLEWRGARDAKGRFAPFATIARMAFENAKVDKSDWWSLLVVTRIGGVLKNACVVAYVDARANPDANGIARRVADAWAVDAKRPCPSSAEEIPFVGAAEGRWKGGKTAAAP